MVKEMCKESFGDDLVPIFHDFRYEVNYIRLLDYKDSDSGP